MKSTFRLLAAFLFFHSVYAQDVPQTVIFKGSVFNLKRENIHILEDKTCKMSLADVTPSKNFYFNTYNIPNLGVSQSAFWVKFNIINNSDHSDLLLNLTETSLDSVDFYLQYPEKTIVFNLGEKRKFSERIVSYPSFIVPLVLRKHESVTCYIRIRSSEQIMVPVSLDTNQNTFESLLNKDLLFGIYCGIILVMFFYNLFIYFTVRDKSYLYYVVYILIVGLTQAVLQGYSYKYLWPNNPWLANFSFFFMSAFVAIVAMIFLSIILQTKKNAPLLHKIFYFFIAVYSIAIAFALMGLYQLSQQIIQINSVSALFSLFVTIVISRQGYKSGGYVLIAWSAFLIGVLIFFMKDFGLVPYNNITIYMMPAGSALETILLSFALADRINILKKEKEASQLQAIEALEANEKLIIQQNTQLESKVKQRTHELETAYRNLKETQSQLVDSEKMASLGQLTAGIAHEINNPINFVVSNITPLRRDINDILELVEKYEQITVEIGLESKLAEIKRFRKEIDVDFVKEEIDLLLKGISEGASRTSEIIRSLRNFSRLDESDFKMANINDGLLSTLVLLSQQFDKITLVRNIGELPKIECYPGKLNQAFMNILTNAIQAVQKVDRARIEVSTSLINENVVISIKDNGSGMTEEVKAKIFEPFFTTKDVGKGTGLGLSITYGIIEKHKGKIEVQSAPSEGTEFIITLPVKRPDIP